MRRRWPRRATWKSGSARCSTGDAIAHLSAGGGRLAAAVSALACALVLPVTLVTLHARAGTGALAGVVQDMSKARVPGCAVSIKNLDGKNQEVAKVNAAGEFGFASIPVGHYAIEVRARGFAVGKTEVLVQAGRRAETVVTLPLGQISEAVTVRAARPASGRGDSRAGAPAHSGGRQCAGVEAGQERGSGLPGGP